MDSKNLSKRLAERPALVVFDLDGTLLDTMGDIKNAVNAALAKQNLPKYTKEQVAAMVGNGVSVLTEKALAGRGNSMAFLADYLHAYRKDLFAETTPYPGMAELLDRLAQEGVSLAVLSNKPQAETARLMAHFFPDVDFAAVWGQREGVPKKPDPSALFALETLTGAEKSRCVLVGDSEVDMETAKAGGWVSLGVTWGYRPAAVLAEASGAILVKSAEELENVLIFS